MKLIVGLGNPGREYRLTRHNVGFMVIEELARANGIRIKSGRRFKALAGKGLIGQDACYLAMPQTFMNRSGYSVRKLVDWLKIELKEVLLVVDDIALPFGTLRLRPKGSDAGHNGMRSVVECLGTEAFSRMRIGILGRKEVKDYSRYVLASFTKNEQKELPGTIERAVSACGSWISEGIDAAMNQYNSR